MARACECVTFAFPMLSQWGFDVAWRRTYCCQGYQSVHTYQVHDGQSIDATIDNLIDTLSIPYRCLSPTRVHRLTSAIQVCTHTKSMMANLRIPLSMPYRCLSPTSVHIPTSATKVCIHTKSMTGYRLMPLSITLSILSIALSILVHFP